MMTQRDLMRRLYVELNGNRDLVIEAYAALDAKGEAPRKRTTGQSSLEYARSLWHNGVHHGWLGQEISQRRKSATPTRTEKSLRVTSFDTVLAELALEWLASDSRPAVSRSGVEHWRDLIETWIKASDMPLLIRKGVQKGIARRHPSGRTLIFCDNSPAHWAFMGCFTGATPSLDDVRSQIDRQTLPFTMARSRDVERHLDEDTQEVGAFLGNAEYGTPMKFPDGFSYKLCHIDAVGIGKRGSPESLDLRLLEDHMRRLLSPENMFLIPQRYAGLGECEAFLEVWRSNRDSICRG